MTDALAHLSTALSDRYAIEHELGAGGMASVYLAEDLKHHAFGEATLAVEQLDTLLSIPSDISVALLRVDPLWDPIRTDSAFQALLAKFEN